MTLVLAACLPDSVILAADSWGFRAADNEAIKYAGICRKLFKLERAGIVTFGGDPNYKSSVPEQIDACIPKDKGPQATCDGLLRHFSVTKGISALVGGFEENGDPALYEVTTPNSRTPISQSGVRPPQLFYRGIANGQVNCRAPTNIGVLDEMMDLLRWNSGKLAGPPYEFLVIERPIQKDD